MKKLYISCYDNLDGQYKQYLIYNNQVRQNSLFTLTPANLTQLSSYDPYQWDADALVRSVKQNVLKNSEVVMFLIGLETKHRKEIDWLTRAAMMEYGFYQKTGIIIVYLPELSTKYGKQIPHSVLPTVLQQNLVNKNAYFVEVSWEKLIGDLNNLERYMHIANAYARISQYQFNDLPLKKEHTHMWKQLK